MFGMLPPVSTTTVEEIAILLCISACDHLVQGLKVSFYQDFEQSSNITPTSSALELYRVLFLAPVPFKNVNGLKVNHNSAFDLSCL
jgi:hypothetical protein